MDKTITMKAWDVRHSGEHLGNIDIAKIPAFDKVGNLSDRFPLAIRVFLRNCQNQSIPKTTRFVEH